MGHANKTEARPTDAHVVSSAIESGTANLRAGLFHSALGLVVALALVGLGTVPLRHAHDHDLASIAIGLGLLGIAVALVVWRKAVRLRIEQQPAWLLAAVPVVTGSQWVDGGWGSTFYVTSFAALALATPSVPPARLRTIVLTWPVALSVLLASAYALMLLGTGYSGEVLAEQRHLDSAAVRVSYYLLGGLAVAVVTNRVVSVADRLKRDLVQAVVTRQIRNPATQLSFVDPKPNLTKNWTKRQVEIVRRYAEGESIADIANELDHSRSWVNARLREMRERAGVRVNVQLIAIAHKEGRLEVQPPVAAEIYNLLDEGLFKTLLVLTGVSIVLATLISPLNPLNSELVVSLAIGAVLLSGTVVAHHHHARLRATLRRRPRWLLVFVALAVAVLAVDGARSPFYLASWTPIMLAVVTTRPRHRRPQLRSWPLTCAVVLALAFVGIGFIDGFGFTDGPNPATVVLKVAGYFLIALAIVRTDILLCGFARTVVRELGERTTTPLTAEEAEMVRLTVEEGLSQAAAADRLGIKPRQARRRLETAQQKAGVGSVRELAAVLAAYDILPTAPKRPSAPSMPR